MIKRSPPSPEEMKALPDVKATSAFREPEPVMVTLPIFPSEILGILSEVAVLRASIVFVPTSSIMTSYWLVPDSSS